MPSNERSEAKQAWEPMKLTPVGHISEVVEGGEGKLTPAGGDPGEGRKEKPTG